MRLIFTFFKAYPTQSIITLGAMLLAGLAEGFGLSMLLPLLGVVINTTSGGEGPGGSTQSNLERYVAGFFDTVGLSPTIGVLLTFFVGGIVLTALLSLLANKKVGYMVAQVATDLRLALIRALFATRWEYYVHQPIGMYTNAYATEANRSADAYLYGIRVIALLLRTTVYAVVALLMAWKETLIALGAGFFILYILRRLVTKAKKAGQRQTNLLNGLLALLTDTLQSIKPLKAMAREDMADLVLQKETNKLNRVLQKQVFSKEALKALQEPLITIFFAFGLYVAMIWWQIPLATVITMAFMLVKIIKTLQSAQKEHQTMVIAESAYWSLVSKIRENEGAHEAIGGTVVPCFDRAIRLDKVSFSYGVKQILRDMSLEFPRGTFSAIIGPSGAGKTTIVDLITGLLSPQSGQVWIDDLDLAAVDLRAWRRMIGYVPQETLLLHDTVLMNVTLGDAKYSALEVEDALRAAGAWGFVSEMPDGIDTVVGERGSRLSGGQRQRITIARALVHKPRLLILDEATSALDPASEAAICATLRQLRGTLTILAISHQTAILEAADRAYRLEGGYAHFIEKNDFARGEGEGFGAPA
ncbi:ABC transporter ATP-binding protein [Desulfoprunum benzoelyticum]|uniref:ATP-binding cassette subfamily C protein n=1 Tax=Desulfoprunum benzoelyticum TaxID=1506996 RepID=A0A840V1F2_9BACT|nr:ABC transporter ATP-binding protein [Desulfoprunum benzoelyticum]MBB5348688.1 ATP-binding cassette subfamily C protein [Desulfoprunum benzoelyticum]MBM9530034.1 ABC transporter ATP-binding protein [Desulfoprunum benzoelyticum]